MRPAALAAALALASIPVAAYAHSPEAGETAGWRAVDADTGKIADIEGIEQLARDSKVLQIYGGTDEIQVSQIARDLLSQ